MLLPRSSSLNCSVRAPLGLVSPATRKRASPIASIIEACLIGFVRTMRGCLDQLRLGYSHYHNVQTHFDLLLHRGTETQKCEHVN